MIDSYKIVTIAIVSRWRYSSCYLGNHDVMGMDGYIESTRKVVETTRWLAKEIHQISGLYIVGEPLSCALGFNFDIYRLNSAMSKKGWELNPLQFPPGLHISVTLYFMQVKWQGYWYQI